MTGSISHEEKFGCDWMKMWVGWDTDKSWKGEGTPEPLGKESCAIYQCYLSVHLKLRILFIENTLGAEFSSSTFSCTTITEYHKIWHWAVEACLWVPEWKGIQGRTQPTWTGKICPKACEDVSYCLGCQPRRGSRWPCLVHLSLKQTLFLRARSGQDYCTKDMGTSFSQNGNPVFVVCE